MPKRVWLLIIGMVINITASSFLWPFNTIYIHTYLGKSLSVAGMALMINSLAAAVGNLAGGYMFDKIGGYKSILSGIIITLVSVAGLVMMHNWPLYVVWLAAIGLGSGMVFPSMYAMIATIWPEGGRRAFNALYVSQNFGVALGSALGGLVASLRIDYIFLANFLLYAVFFVLAVIGFRNIETHATHIEKEERKQSIWKITPMFQSLLILCFAYLLCWGTYVQWQGVIPTHMQDLNISLQSYSLLWTVNGAFIVLGQPLIQFIVRIIKASLKQQFMIGTVIFMISFAIVSQAEHFGTYMIAMVILTFGEMFAWPAVPTIANQLAPKGKAGFYQGLVNSAATGGRMLGPLVGGMIFDAFHIHVLFIVILATLLLAFLIARFYDYKLVHKKEIDGKISV
ncbi:MDR family MFS transporter [Ectobacillus polymachus]|uniref:MDR family MFS transporter n=1 Tax=Ectobacillus polymachus TaxID=1508806 RepID=UPI003A896C6E